MLRHPTAAPHRDGAARERRWLRDAVRRGHRPGRPEPQPHPGRRPRRPGPHGPRRRVRGRARSPGVLAGRGCTRERASRRTRSSPRTPASTSSGSSSPTSTRSRSPSTSTPRASTSSSWPTSWSTCATPPRARGRRHPARGRRPGRAVASPTSRTARCGSPCSRAAGDYTETGLLDATHLHFFTRASLLDLLDEAGLGVEELRSTVADPMAVEVDVDRERLPATIIEWVRHQRDALDYQFVVSAGRAVGRRGAPARCAAPGGRATTCARVDDRWTDQMRAEQETRHRLLTTRDHVIGLEARASAADDRLRWVEGRLRRSRARQRTGSRSRCGRSQGSATWRVGRLLTRPFRRTPGRPQPCTVLLDRHPGVRPGRGPAPADDPFGAPSRSCATGS